MNIPPSAMQPSENDDFVTDLDSQQRLRKYLELSQRIHVIKSQRSIVSNVKCLDGLFHGCVASSVRTDLVLKAIAVISKAPS
jgi:hypothetical protein